VDLHSGTDKVHAKKKPLKKKYLKRIKKKRLPPRVSVAGGNREEGNFSVEEAKYRRHGKEGGRMTAPFKERPKNF